MEWNTTILTLKTTHPTLTRVREYTLSNLASEITLDELASVAKVSPFYLCRLFKEQTGYSPIKWLWHQRTCAAAAYITKYAHKSLTDIAFTCGFSSSAHFSRQFKSVYGVSPSQFKKRQLQTATSGHTNFNSIHSIVNRENYDTVEHTLN